MSVTPFTQGFEDAKEMNGNRVVDDNTESFYKRLYNIVYTNAIPQVLEFNILKAEMTPVTMNADFKTGTITATSGSKTITLASGTFPSVVAVGWKFKIESGNDTDDIYEINTRDSDTQLTLKRTFLGTTASSLTYVVYQDLFSLPSDYATFTTNPRFYFRDGGSVFYFRFREDGLFLKRQTSVVGVPSEARLALAKDSSDNFQIQLNAGFDEDRLVYGEYIRQFDNLTEYVEGTVAVTNNSTGITGTDTLWNTNIVAGDYFRVDTDKTKDQVWYKVSSVTNDTAIVLSTVYAGDTASGKAYTIAKPPLIPERWHNMITYGIAALGAANQDDSDGYQRYQQLSGIPGNVLGSLKTAEARERYGTQRIATVYQRNTRFSFDPSIRR